MSLSEGTLPTMLVQSLISTALLLATFPTQTQAVIECNVLNYGAVADNVTDIGPALTAAWQNCVIPSVNSTVATDVQLLVPSGDFRLTTMVLFNHATHWNFHLVGNLYLPFNTTLGGIGGTMLQWQNCDNILFDGPGAIFGNGYRYRENNDLSLFPNRPRLVRFQTCNNIEITEITLYDAPMFHVTIIGNNNLAHDMTIRATHVGETDGFDMSGNNKCENIFRRRILLNRPLFSYVHDVIVENGDECVTVKTPTNGFRAENLICIHTAGCNIGSFGAGNTNVSVQNVWYRNVTLNETSDAGIMIKSYPDNIGFVRNITYHDFTLIEPDFPLYIGVFWRGNGIDTGKLEISDVHFDGISGFGSTTRPAVLLDCNAATPCKNITFESVYVWGGVANQITNACGSGFTGVPAC
ncbi:unnamed protein product [Mycena citricolor]|uniref:Glycoside hydrolase family 28 protein n=1 Tax=Mycena citricolor TaxID=2018698 RepID=A0AAD2JUC0_9AGAR|nr:unnamed protein product [Mycena citricolor]